MREEEEFKIMFHALPDDVVFVQDGSWYPRHTTMGAQVAANALTGWWRVYAIPLPMYLDGLQEPKAYGT